MIDGTHIPFSTSDFPLFHAVKPFAAVDQVEKFVLFVLLVRIQMSNVLVKALPLRQAFLRMSTL